MLRRAGLDRGGGGLDVGVPAPRRWTRLIVEVAAGPFENLVARFLVGKEGGPVNGDKAAAAFHLLFEDEQPVADEEWVVLFAPIAAAGNQHDGIGVIESAFVARP